MHFSCVCVWAQIAPTHEARTLARLTMPVGACVLTPVAMRCASPRRASAWRLCILRARTPWRAQKTVRRCGSSRARRCDVFYMVECCAGGCSRPCRLPSPTVRRTHAALPRRPARSPSGLCARHTYSLPHHALGTACQPKNGVGSRIASWGTCPCPCACACACACCRPEGTHTLRPRDIFLAGRGADHLACHPGPS